MDSNGPAAATDTPAANFIRAIVEEDLRRGRYERRVVTRFPPEPNGYLHIGHAKAIVLNFGIAADYDGICNLRFDDTNPTTEDVEYVESIKSDVAWLGADYGAHLYFGSDYFERMYELAEFLITKGLAYVDSADRETMREHRGTLTEPGRPTPDRAVLQALGRDEAAIALALASHSRHPLSHALARALTAAGHKAAELTDVQEVAGTGVLARWNGQTVALSRPGSAAGMGTALTIGQRPPRLIAFADRLRPDADEALARLRRLGLEASIISGDSAEAVAQVAGETGLESESRTTPAEKQQAIARLQSSGHSVLMVGDGLNDGPALAAADASIAPGSASDVGLQAADFVFVSDSLLAVPRAISAARASMRVVRQNFTLAIIYNVLAVPLALAGLLTPLIAAAAMSGSSLVVIANSLRLARAVK